MLNSLQEIRENSVVNKFPDTARKYGLSGTYINWAPGGVNEPSVYFVCGLDKSQIFDPNIDFLQILDNQEKSRHYLCTDVMAFKLTGNHPLMVQYDFIKYCRRMDAAQKIYGHFNLSLPVRISKDVLETMTMTWNNFQDGRKSLELRDEYKNMLSFAIKVESQGFDHRDPEYKKNHYLLCGYYDSGKGRIYNWFKRHFFKYKNQVSLSHLVAQTGDIKKIHLTCADAKQIKKLLDARPDILYNFSEIRGDVLKVDDSEGFGSKELNDRRFRTLHYPACYDKNVKNMLQQIHFPKEYALLLEDVDPHNKGTEHIVIPWEYCDMLKARCDSDGAIFCIDKMAYDVVDGGVPIAFSVANGAQMYQYLIDILRSSEMPSSAAMVAPPPNQNSASLEDLLQKLKESGFTQIDPQRANRGDLSIDR